MAEVFESMKILTSFVLNVLLDWIVSGTASTQVNDFMEKTYVCGLDVLTPFTRRSVLFMGHRQTA